MALAHQNSYRQRLAFRTKRGRPGGLSRVATLLNTAESQTAEGNAFWMRDCGGRAKGSKSTRAHPLFNAGNDRRLQRRSRRSGAGPHRERSDGEFAGGVLR